LRALDFCAERLKFHEYVLCAHARGDEVSDELLCMLDELCSRSHIHPDDLIEEMARRDGLVKVRLDSGETILCFPDQMERLGEHVCGGDSDQNQCL
jgi:hypothetical protein